LSICVQSDARYNFTDQAVLLYRNNPQSAMTNIDGLGEGYSLLIKKIKTNKWATYWQLFALKLKVTKIMFLSHLFDGGSVGKALRVLVRYW